MKVASITDVMVSAAVTVPVITKTEVDAAIEAGNKVSALGKALREAEKEHDAARLVVLSKALGINTLDEIKYWDEVKVKAAFMTRLKNKAFITANVGVNFCIRQTFAAAIPAWKELFIQFVSGSKALEVAAATPKQYSYRIENE